MFVLSYFSFWPLCRLSFFDIGILIAPLVSSNSSYNTTLPSSFICYMYHAIFNICNTTCATDEAGTCAPEITRCFKRTSYYSIFSVLWFIDYCLPMFNTARVTHLMFCVMFHFVFCLFGFFHIRLFIIPWYLSYYKMRNIKKSLPFLGANANLKLKLMSMMICSLFFFLFF